MPGSPGISAYLQAQFLDASRRFPWLCAARIDATEPKHDSFGFPFHWRNRLLALTNSSAVLGPAYVLFAAAGEEGRWATAMPHRDSSHFARPLGVDCKAESAATAEAISLAEQAAVALLGPSTATGVSHDASIDACRWLARLLENPTGRAYQCTGGLVSRACQCGFFLESAQLIDTLAKQQGEVTGGGDAGKATKAKGLGRPPKAVTKQRVEFAKQGVRQGKDWGQIEREYKRTYRRDRSATAETIRRAYQHEIKREENRKAMKQPAKTGKNRR